MAKHVPKIVAATVLVALIGFLVVTRDPVSAQLGSFGVSMGLSGFKETSFTTGTAGEESFEAVRGQVTVDIDRSQPVNHTKFVSDRQIVFNSLFEPMHSPYPEVITNTLDCPDDLKPKEASTSAGVVYYLPAGGQQNYGICSDDLVHYQSVYGIFDCQGKGVFEVRIFSPEKSDLTPLIDSFSCRG